MMKCGDRIDTAREDTDSEATTYRKGAGKPDCFTLPCLSHPSLILGFIF